VANNQPANVDGVRWEPYWLATAPVPGDWSNTELPGKVDVAIVGGGLTGLSAAIHLAGKRGSVAVLEKHTFGWGASGRNGGMCTTGASIGYLSLVKRYGQERANKLYTTYNDAIDLVEQIVTREHIDCDFERTGKLSLAAKHEHFRAFEKTHLALARNMGYETQLVPAAEISREIGTRAYVGAIVDVQGAGVHVGKLVRGFAQVAGRSGVGLHEQAAVGSVRRLPDGQFEVTTGRGTLWAAQVLVATDGYTDGAVPRFRRRIIPVGSFVIVTEPLDAGLVDRLMPTRRMAADSLNLTHYFRITPDNRLLFGGRAHYAVSGPKANQKSARILRRDMVGIFPELRDTRIEYAWGGDVGFTFDRIPHAGEDRGIYFSLGYCGHGVQMATYMGRAMAEVMDGHPEANPWRDFRFPVVPGHVGPPWFLPLADIYYRLKDRVA
jgi:glycine/D-amino acid oxidase-like deaminating enzyme